MTDVCQFFDSSTIIPRPLASIAIKRAHALHICLSSPLVDGSSAVLAIRAAQTKEMLRAFNTWTPIFMLAPSFRSMPLQPSVSTNPSNFAACYRFSASGSRLGEYHRQAKEVKLSRSTNSSRSHIGRAPPGIETVVDALNYWVHPLFATRHRGIFFTPKSETYCLANIKICATELELTLRRNSASGPLHTQNPMSENEQLAAQTSAHTFGIEPKAITSPCPPAQVACKLNAPTPSPRTTSCKDKSALGESRNEKNWSKKKSPACMATDLSLQERQGLTSTSDLDTPLLLADLKSLQLVLDSTKRDISEKAVQFWHQWHTFLMSPKGKAIQPEMLHKVSHAFFFSSHPRLSDLFCDVQTQERSGIQFEARTIRLLGFAGLKAQHWSSLDWVLQHPKLSMHDFIILVKALCRKIAFSSALVSQSSRVAIILDLTRSIGLKIENDIDLAGQVGLVVECIARTLFKMQCIDPVVPYIVQIFEKYPTSVASFSSAFLHQVMNTCASHHYLDQAHQLLAAIPPSLQTLDHYKACLTVWDRRTPRPLIRAACLLWNTLQSHPHLKPDLASYNLYLSLRSRLGHTKVVSDIIERMKRTGPAPDQRTLDILLHSLGQRQGTECAWDTLRYWSPEKYTPTSRTTNILLCSKLRGDRTAQRLTGHVDLPVENEMKFLAIMERVKAANFESDEVTRNIVVQKFLARSYSHSPQQIWALKELVLPAHTGLSSSDKRFARREFRRVKKPLYSILWSAFVRAGQKSDADRLAEEWGRENRLARMHDSRIQKSS